MSAISTILTRLRAAIWAIDVRDDIANAIEQCYSDVSNPTLQTEALEAALQTKIDEGEMAALTIGDGTITAAKLASGVIDNTLATSGAAADAKKTGDEIAAVKADLDAVNEFIGDTDEPISYDLENSDFTRKVKFVYGNTTAYPFTATHNGFITYAAFDLAVTAGKQYTITAEVPSAYAETAGMIVIPYNQTLLDAYTNHKSCNTNTNARPILGWQGLEQTITIPDANDEPCVGILLSFRQADANPSIDDNFTITSVHIEEVVPTGSVVRYDLDQSKTDAEKEIARANIGAAFDDATPSYRGYVTKANYQDLAHVVTPGTYFVASDQNYSDAPINANARLFVFQQSASQGAQFWLCAVSGGTYSVYFRSIDRSTCTALNRWTILNDSSSQYVTPQMYGAKGDGVTDDTVAFQNAINTGYKVYVPSSKGQIYVITDTLVVSSNRQFIYGDIDAPDWAWSGIYFKTQNKVLFDFKDGLQGCVNLNMRTDANSGNTAIRFNKASDVTNIDGSVHNCSIRLFDIAIDHYGRGLSVKRNLFWQCNTGIKTTIMNEPRWDHNNPTSSEIFQTYPEYNGRSLYMVDNRFHLATNRYLLVVSEDYVSGSTTIRQVLNGAIISGNMGDLGMGSFEFQAPIKGCVFSNNEFLRVSPDVFFDCKYGASECTIANNTIRGLIDNAYPSINSYGKDCFAFNGLNYSSISGNVVENFKQRCVYIYGAGMLNSAVIGNIFKNYGIDTTANQYERAGFDVPSCENSIISNNTFMTVSDFNGYLIRARDISSNIWKRNVFNDNTCTKRSSAEVLVPTTAGTEDNIIQGVS